MSSKTKENIAFCIGMLAAFYAVCAVFGLTCLIWIAVHNGPSIRDYLLAPMLALVVGTPVAILSFRYRRTLRRIEAGACPSCGYDLRATPDRCPECGTIPAKKDVMAKRSITDF